MRISFEKLIAIILLACAPPLFAASDVRIVTLQSEAWVVSTGSRDRPDAGQFLAIGDRIATGESGRVDIEATPGITMLINPASEISVSTGAAVATDETATAVRFTLLRGKVCIDHDPRPDRGNRFELDIGGMLFAAIRHRGRICAHRGDDSSSVTLREGSVQLTHAVDESMIVLSDAGTEFRIDDEGLYDLLLAADEQLLTAYDESPLPAQAAPPPEQASGGEPASDNNLPIADGSGTGENPTTVEASQPALANPPAQPAAQSTPQEPKPVVVTETEAADSAQDPALAALPADGADAAPATQATVQQPGSGDDGAGVSSGYNYTVYLFSTRSEEVADRVNRRLHDAGQDSRILKTEQGEVTRYRIAVSGFEDRASAERYSSSIVGKLGIADTWIGRQPASVDAN